MEERWNAIETQGKASGRLLQLELAAPDSQSSPRLSFPYRAKWILFCPSERVLPLKAMGKAVYGHTEPGI